MISKAAGISILFPQLFPFLPCSSWGKVLYVYLLWTVPQTSSAFPKIHVIPHAIPKQKAPYSSLFINILSTTYDSVKNLAFPWNLLHDLTAETKLPIFYTSINFIYKYNFLRFLRPPNFITINPNILVYSCHPELLFNMPDLLVNSLSHTFITLLCFVHSLSPSKSSFNYCLSFTVKS